MVSPLNSLTNMEYMLYGGASGVNPNCPSFSNGYMANRNSWNYQMPYGYNNQSIWNNQYGQNYGYGNVGGTTNYGASVTSQDSQQASQTGFGASARDMDTLGKYYLKGMEPSESLLGAAGGGAAFALVNNTRFIAHPFASLSSVASVEKMFVDVKKDGSALNKLWSNPETSGLMRDAYHKMHKLEGASKWRFAPLFKARLDEKVYNSLKAEMEEALRLGDKQKIAEAVEKIKVATGAKTGVIPRAWNSFKIQCGFKPSELYSGKEKTITKDSVMNALNKKVSKSNYAEQQKFANLAKKNLTDKVATGYGEAIKKGFKSQGLKGGAFFAAMEFLMDFGKIKSAFSKDNKTGAKQLGQTSVKASGSIVGWTVGEAVGAAAGAKIGAAVGTAFCPGLGTAIGAVAGLIGGSIGCWAMGKLTKKLVGEDVGSKVEVDKMKKTAQGQAQLLQLTAQQAQDDKKLDPKVKQALQNVISSYNAVA